MVKTTLYLEDETALVLKQLAQAQGRSQSQVIREALAAYTAVASLPQRKGIGAYRSGRADISDRAEELLRERARNSR